MKNYKIIYFLGIGGIGMSALARYFKSLGLKVIGYDRNLSPLTQELEKEGIEIHYTDNVALLNESSLNPDNTLVVYTPAIPKDLAELLYFQGNNFTIVKRSVALGEAVRNQTLLAVAGTHGKTTTSSLLAHLMHNSNVGASAFLGGIVVQYKSNLLLSPQSSSVIVEADEYDRSFHQLYPDTAIITSLDPDHLDIYETNEAYLQAFDIFISQIQEGGTLFIKKDLEKNLLLKNQGINIYTYTCDGIADVYSSNIRVENGKLLFDWNFPKKNISIQNLELGSPIKINVENATAAIASAYIKGVSPQEIRQNLASFRGVKRRFEQVLQSDKFILIDDYAHHPKELNAAISSLKFLYPNEAILGIFQPHLYSRTKDFYKDFATALSSLDEVILLPIYPARELPIKGVESHLILEEMTANKKSILTKDELLQHITKRDDLPKIIVTLGAGDIDRLVLPLADILQNKL